MCVVSMVIGDWQHPTWPGNPPAVPGTLPSPNAIPWPMIQKDPELAAQMLEVLKRLESIDKRLGLMEQCKVAEPEKKRLKARLRRIAKKQRTK